jgi:GNAT superfamily N-acetyltransferase
MRVRTASVADAEAIAAVHIASWRAAYVGLIPQDFLDAMDLADRRERWQGILTNNRWPSAASVLERDGGLDGAGDVVGFIHYGPTRDEDGDPATTGSVDALYLVREVWRSGGGRALMAAAEEELSRAGFPRATLWLLQGNERGARFYEQLGWRLDGATNQRDWGSFVAEELRYHKTLARSESPGATSAPSEGPNRVGPP